LGRPAGPVIASIHEKRDEIRRTLQKAAEAAGLSQIHAVKPKTIGTLRRRSS
jgi:monovalent cation:H+ antiporter-2, CPA2 family